MYEIIEIVLFALSSMIDPGTIYVRVKSQKYLFIKKINRSFLGNHLTRAALKGAKNAPTPLVNFLNISQASCLAQANFQYLWRDQFGTFLRPKKFQVRSRSYDVISEGSHY